MSVVLKDLLLDSKDGEWGRGEPFEGSIAMLAIRGTDFDDVRLGALHSVPRRHISSRIAARKTLRPLDIVFETAGGSKDRPTGRSVLLKERHFTRTDSPVTCASFARFLRIDPLKADPEYVFWLLQHMYNAGILKQYHTQHTGVARYQYTTFAENEALSFPDRDVQRRIASVLSAYDDLIENNTRRIAILEEVARRIYEEWFVHFRFPGHKNVRMVESEIGLVPEDWRIQRLGELISFRKGRKPGQVSKVPASGLVPMLLIDALRGGPLEYAAPDKLLLVAESDTIMVMDGSGSCEVFIGHEGAIGSTLGRYKSESRGLGAFCLYLLLLTRKEEIRAKNIGAAIPHANKDYINSIEVAVPSSDIAQQFERLVAPLFALRKALRIKNVNLRTTRDLLLPRLISGELDVSAMPEPEAAAA